MSFLLSTPFVPRRQKRMAGFAVAVALGLSAAAVPRSAEAGFYQITADAIVSSSAIPNATGYDQRTNGATLLCTPTGPGACAPIS
jgi:hypothetical protein